jgi:hypothetical protein
MSCPVLSPARKNRLDGQGGGLELTVKLPKSVPIKTGIALVRLLE